MKLTKSGEIEACCDWSRQYSGEPVSKFCPNCGSTTEIEGEENHD